MISVFLYLLRFSLCSSMWLVLEKNGLLKRGCILFYIGRIVCLYLWGPFLFMISFNFSFSLFSFYLDDLCIGGNGYWSQLLSIFWKYSVSLSTNVCLMKLSIYIFRINIFFMNMKWPSLSLLIDFGWSILLAIRIAILS